MFLYFFPEEAPAANTYVEETPYEEPAQVGVLISVERHFYHKTYLNLLHELMSFLLQVDESNSYEMTVEETSDKGICARALYDYQAGELSQCNIKGWIMSVLGHY